MRILIAAGLSGGHIFPAIATAFKLKELNMKNEIFFIGSKKGLDIEILKHGGHNFDLLSSNKQILKDVFLAFLILKRFKPDVAVGFGGYVSFPVLSIAKALGIPTVIHEQNLVPGLANKLLSGLVNRIAVSFEETPRFLKAKSRIIETGNPIRFNLVKLDKEKILQRFGLSTDKFTILVMGGSQGAHFINETVLAMLKDTDKVHRKGIQFIHLSGLTDFEFVKSGYASLGVENRVFSFFDRMSEAYSASDLAICRAGATSIAELAFFGLPAILIPYPNPKVHQLENAEFVERKGAAIVIKQETLSKSSLKGIIFDLINNKNKLKIMSEKALRISRPDAANKVAMEILSVVKG